MAIEGYDLVMLGIVAVAALLGYFKGIVWQVAWIAGIALSSYVAVRFGGPLAPFFGQQPPWNRLFAMLALYVSTSLVVWLVFGVVAGAINAVHLSAFDHQLGLLLGLAKGVLICIVVTFFAVTLAPGYRQQIVASRSGRLVAEAIIRAEQILPRDVAETVHPFAKQFEDQLRRPPAAPPAGTRPVGGTGPARPSALQAIWEGITSAHAFTGSAASGQGPGQPATGAAAPSEWPAQQVPGGSPLASQRNPPPTAQPGFNATPPAGGMAAPQYQAWPANVAPQQAWPQQPAAGQPSYPVGAQSPLRYR